MTNTKTINATKYKAELMNDPAVRFWVKDILNRLDERDPVDALNDVMLLKKYCEVRLQDIQQYYR